MRNRIEEIDNLLTAPGVFVEDRSISALRSILLQIAEYKLKQVATVDTSIDEPLSPLVIEFQDLLESHYRSQREVSFFVMSSVSHQPL